MMEEAWHTQVNIELQQPTPEQGVPQHTAVVSGQHIYPVQEMVGFSPLLPMVMQYGVNFSIQMEVVLVYAKTMQEMNTTY